MLCTELRERFKDSDSSDAIVVNSSLLAVVQEIGDFPNRLVRLIFSEGAPDELRRRRAEAFWELGEVAWLRSVWDNGHGPKY